MSGKGGKGPLARSKAWLIDHAAGHGTLVAVAAGCLAFALLAVLLWFLVFSGLNGPVQFVYAGF
ncbi:MULTISPECIES: hypothetical protein [Olsenella]|uniref:hypothetical protein n=1 Tax=Olsenella TaxID=133925 RepID=UPI000231F286|nr:MULTISPECIES: hypothetical protein [Olsenella]EHF02515.1 hypothetical protein HMPREF1008_00160 [Olsenella sp. oral taxon 809 str. F0356]KXB63688.1 hypothetical protein HMPREF1868_00198 [Olsenella sp. DNF00959]